MIIRCGFAGFFFLFLVLFAMNRTSGQTNPGQIHCICIDAGHGGKDPGALGLKSKEKDIVLNLALKVGKLIKANYPEVKVVYTRDKDVFIDLDKRGKIANDHKADLFISIHINSSTAKSPNGLSTYVLGLHRTKENLEVAMKENSVIKYEKDYSVKYAGFDPNRAESYIIFSLMQNLYLEKSLELAALVQEEMVNHTKKRDRGVLQAGYLVLKDAAMPAILIEAGFISNQEEERFLMTQTAQNKIALSIFKAIERYKNKVEKNSNLLVKEEKKETITVPSTKNLPEQRVNAEASPALFYAVQIASASSKIKDRGRLCRGENVYEMRSGERYRYYVAQSENLGEVKKNLEKIKNKVRDCFIIAVHNGRVIPIAEARKLEKQ